MRRFNNLIMVYMYIFTINGVSVISAMPFLPFFSKGDNFCDIMFISLDKKTLPYQNNVCSERLLGCLALTALSDSNLVYTELPARGREKEERKDRKIARGKKYPNNPICTYCKHSRPFAILSSRLVQTCRTPWH